MAVDVTRAEEIFQAKEVIGVQFEGRPVWIEGVDNRSKTARVYEQGNPQDKLTVAVSDLVEVH